jgi:hypothetical protein
MKLSELFEARKNPEQNPKLGPVAQLFKYKDDPDVYISMTKLPKLGINPQTTWRNTPNGIYTFNLSQLLSRTYDPNKSLSSLVTRPFDFLPYIQVIRAKKVKVLDVNTYTESDYTNDVKKLTKLYPDLTDKIQEFQQNVIFHDHEYSYMKSSFPDIDMDNPFIKIFGLTKFLSKSANGWNKNLRALGYMIVNDPGKGYISKYEWMQTVFLDPKAYIHLDTLRNVDYHGTSKADVKMTYQDIPGLITRAKISNKQITKYEPAIMKYPEYAAQYANEVLRGRFSRYEKMVLSKQYIYDATVYYRKVIAPKRWPELEKILHLDAKAYLMYAIASKHRIKSIEPDVIKLAQEDMDEDNGRCWYAQELALYAIDVIKGPWPEAEPCIKTNEYEYSRYIDGIHNLSS